MAPRAPKVFSAVDVDTPDENLELIPVTLEGLRLRPVPRPGRTIPAEVKVALDDWLAVPAADRAEMVAEHELLTTWSETFRFLPYCPTGVLDDMMRSIQTNDLGEQVFHAPSLNRFMAGAMLEDDVPRFLALTRDKNRLLPIDSLGRAALWLASETTDRPTGPPSA